MKHLFLVLLGLFTLLPAQAAQIFPGPTVFQSTIKPNATGQDMNDSSSRWDIWVGQLNTPLATGFAYIDSSGNLARLAYGTSAQYYRGDGTVQTLDTAAVPENGNLYFTNLRAWSAFTFSAPLTDNGSGGIGCRTASGSQSGCVSASDWTTFNSKGDASTNTSSSVDGEVALFSGTGGKTLKRATGTGIAKITSGVLSTATSGTDYAPATSGTSILKGDGAGGFSNAVSSTDYAPATSGSSILKGNGSGGFSNAASGTDYAPATSGTSVLKGNGSGGFSSAVSGTDYAPATSSTSLLKGNGSGGFSNAVAGTDYQVPITAGDGTTSGGTFTLANTGVSAGSYTSADITIDAKGRITAAANGTGGGGGGGSSTLDQMIHVGYSTGYGSTNTTVKRYAKVFRQKGTYITYTQSSTNGDSFTVNSAGNGGAYRMCAADFRSGTAPVIAITKNGSALTTSASSLTRAQGLLARGTIGNTGGAMAHVCWVEKLATNDVIRVQTSGNEAGDTGAWFYMTYIGPSGGQATLYTGNGYGSGAAYIRKFSNTSASGTLASAITQSGTNGDKIVAQNAKVYSICFADGGNSTGMDTGLSINASSLSTDIFSLSLANGRRIYYNHADSGIVSGCYTKKLAANDEIRLHNDGTSNDTTDATALTAVEIDYTGDNIQYVTTGSGNGTESRKPYFSNYYIGSGNSVAYVPSTYSGDHFIIADAGIYDVCFNSWNNSSAILKSALTIGPDRLGSVDSNSLTYLHGIVAYRVGGNASDGNTNCFTRYFSGGGIEDMVSVHTAGETLRTVDQTTFWITRTQ